MITSEQRSKRINCPDGESTKNKDNAFSFGHENAKHLTGNKALLNPFSIIGYDQKRDSEILRRVFLRGA
jgi:hypothetical protein